MANLQIIVFTFVTMLIIKLFVAMKKIIYSLSILVLFICAGCGSDEPEEAGNIACQAYIKNDKGVTEKTDAVFFLFEGTGYTELDLSTYESLPAQKIKAVRSNGSKEENIGWCTCSKENSGLIVPVYSASDKDRLARTQAGTFTIVCMATYRYFNGAYMMKTFTKKKSEPVPINATFWYSDFTEMNGTVKVSWR